VLDKIRKNIFFGFINLFLVIQLSTRTYTRVREFLLVGSGISGTEPKAPCERKNRERQSSPECARVLAVESKRRRAC